MNKPGRPKLPKGKARGKTRLLRLTPAEDKQLRQMARTARKPVVEIIRGKVFA